MSRWIRERVAQARHVYNTQHVGSTGSDGTPHGTSAELRPANMILPSLSEYDAFSTKLEETPQLRAMVLPKTFTEGSNAKQRTMLKILKSVYTFTNIVRDNPDLGGSLAEAYLERFKDDAHEDSWSPATEIDSEAFEELLNNYDMDPEGLIGPDRPTCLLHRALTPHPTHLCMLVICPPTSTTPPGLVEAA